ncbi:MAG TPA: aldehyde dehydrogenase family protein [Anaerolineales bacterium]|nr:aldehyde dehydrogenase family protein [Anaerolineales bacterium]
MSAIERLREAATRSAKAGSGSSSTLGEFGILVDGRWVETGEAIEVHSPYDDSLVAVVHRAGPQDIETAISRAVEAFEETRRMPAWRRAGVLESISQGIATRREAFARTIALEAGKPIRTARAEVDRAIFTFKVAA